MSRALVLHQFPISHYCEKIRWVLEHKGLPYAVKNQVPGMHMLVNHRLVGRGSVPVLVDGGHAIGESSDIALYLDDQYPQHNLVPRASVERAEVLSLEAYFDEHAGPAVRRYVYGYVLRDVGLFRRVFGNGYGAASRAALALVSLPVSKQIRKMYKVSAAGNEEALVTIERVIERLEQLTGGDPDRYLVGDTLTLADVTAASLLGPLLAPPESPWAFDLPIPELTAQRDALRTRAAGRWVMRRYQSDRRRVEADAR
ncbi:MAG: glutathione S-transferase [Polyangiales bacterium]